MPQAVQMCGQDILEIHGRHKRHMRTIDPGMIVPPNAAPAAAMFKTGKISAFDANTCASPQPGNRPCAGDGQWLKLETS